VVLLVVAGAVEDLDRVGEQVGDRFEGFDGAFGAAGKIDDKGFVASGGDATGEDGCWSFLGAFAAHFFGDAGDEPVGNGLGGFGRVVARADAGAARSGDQVDATRVGKFAKIFADGGGIICDTEAGGDFPAEAAAEGDDCGAGGVFAFAFGDGIRDGEDGDAHGPAS
jgi:hypothetical protein